MLWITSIYWDAAKRYLPDERITTLFIAESPPHYNPEEEPRYFYFNKLRGKEHLFRNMMSVLNPKGLRKAIETADKASALLAFKKAGYFLTDATDIPVNHLDFKRRIIEIQKGLPSLVGRVQSLADKSTPIILIKKATLKPVQDRLVNLGFNIIGPEPLPFPAYGNQKRFRNSLRSRLAGLKGS